MGVTINNESTTTEPLPENGQQHKPLLTQVTFNKLGRGLQDGYTY